jgi:hypothetical protein
MLSVDIESPPDRLRETYEGIEKPTKKANMPVRVLIAVILGLRQIPHALKYLFFQPVKEFSKRILTCVYANWTGGRTITNLLFFSRFHVKQIFVTEIVSGGGSREEVRQS